MTLNLFRKILSSGFIFSMPLICLADTSDSTKITAPSYLQPNSIILLESGYTEPGTPVSGTPFVSLETTKRCPSNFHPYVTLFNTKVVNGDNHAISSFGTCVNEIQGGSAGGYKVVYLFAKRAIGFEGSGISGTPSWGAGGTGGAWGAIGVSWQVFCYPPNTPPPTFYTGNPFCNTNSEPYNSGTYN